MRHVQKALLTLDSKVATMSLGWETFNKWSHVYFSLDYESICGTLFLLSPNPDETIIQWIADDGTLSEEHAPPKIYLSTITQVERSRLSFNRGSFFISLRTHDDNFGPFDFTAGGSTEFINKLRLFVDLEQIPGGHEVYKVKRKTATYQLPTSDFSPTPMMMIQGVGTRLMNVFEGLRLSADAALNGGGGGIGGGLRSHHRFSPDFIDTDAEMAAVLRHGIHADRLATETTFVATDAPDDAAGFQLVSRAPAPEVLVLPDLRPVPRRRPLTKEQWSRYLDPQGRVTMVKKLQIEIYHGGIEPELRSVVWKYLFGYLKWGLTDEENAERIEKKNRHYQIMKTFWRSMSVKQARNFRLFKESKNIIEKDTYRTDRQTDLFRDNSNGALTRLYNVLMTYTFYNMDLGYFQGMNDLLAVIMTSIDGEEEAFWCFAGLLDCITENSGGPSNLMTQFVNLFKLLEILMPRFAQFLREKDATSMSFCFKWFLIIFKREFSYDDIKILWETLYCGVAPKNFLLLVAVAIFDAEADTIMRTCSDMSQILQYINGLSEKINLNNVLSRAQGIYNQLCEAKGRLPQEVAVFMGFLAPTSSPSNEERRRTSVENDNDDLFGSCDFSLDPLMGGAALVPVPTSDDFPPSGSSNCDKGDDLEVGEDVLYSADGSIDSREVEKRSLLY